jgi:hypothetical protein
MILLKKTLAVCKHLTLLVSILTLNLYVSCKKPPVNPTEPTPLPEFELGVSAGLVQSQLLDEISGMAASQNMKGNLWVHNDSGNPAEMYLIDSQANMLATFAIAGITNRDWEDLTSTSIGNQNYLLLADTGDNLISYQNEYYIYRFKEPKSYQSTGNTVTDVEKITFKYPDTGHDSEAILADRITNDIYIFTKRDAKCRVYRLPYPQKADSPNTAEFVSELPFGGTFGAASLGATAASISPDNKEIIIKNYFQIFYWQLAKNETIKQALSRSYDKLLPYNAAPQEEAMCWAADASGYFTIAEKGENSNLVSLFFSKRKK